MVICPAVCAYNGSARELFRQMQLMLLNPLAKQQAQAVLGCKSFTNGGGRM